MNIMKNEPIAYELSGTGHSTEYLPVSCMDEINLTSIIGEKNLRTGLPKLPELSEYEAVRHYTALSHMNYGVDSGFYPLGSCTMKYNPKISEALSRLPGFTGLHPCQSDEDSQGALRLMYELERALSIICGMDSFTLSPAAGAHGELTGLMIIAAYHRSRGDSARRVILVPDTAHGTNPASAAAAGFEVRQIPSGPDGLVDVAALRAAAGSDVAGLMLTNPNTLGLFEREILDISAIVHEAGGLLYYDGANLNAILCRTTPALMGFDVVHLNLHKTFGTPHGGGGPGSGPVGVAEFLRDFLPSPYVEKIGERYVLKNRGEPSIGRVRSYAGNFGVLIKAYAYILANGAEGLRQVSAAAVYNANYIQERLKSAYYLPYDRPCMHECVLSARRQKDISGVTAMDIAKGLIDRGFHPPTVYFPLVVPEAMMIEPTETAGQEALDLFIEAMLDIAEKAEIDPESLKSAPHNAPISRPDEVKAAREPVLRYR